jgi:hypothetical protein
MSVELYRKSGPNGTESQLFHPKRFRGALESGEWFLSPEEAKAFEEVDTNNTGKLSAKEIRAAAKEAGIEDWKDGKLADLKKQLGFA